MMTDRKIFFVYCYFEMNVLHWCPFVHLFDTRFQNSPNAHDLGFDLYNTDNTGGTFSTI